MTCWPVTPADSAAYSLARSKKKKAVMNGPIALVYKEIQKLNGTWPSPWWWRTEGGQAVPVAGGPNSWWGHAIREEQRLASLREASRKRPSLQGIEGGLEIELCIILLRFRGSDKLRCIMCV